MSVVGCMNVVEGPADGERHVNLYEQSPIICILTGTFPVGTCSKASLSELLLGANVLGNVSVQVGRRWEVQLRGP